MPAQALLDLDSARRSALAAPLGEARSLGLALDGFHELLLHLGCFSVCISEMPDEIFVGPVLAPDVNKIDLLIAAIEVAAFS